MTKSFHPTTNLKKQRSITFAKYQIVRISFILNTILYKSSHVLLKYKIILTKLENKIIKLKEIIIITSYS